MAQYVTAQLAAAGRFSTLPIEAVTLASGGSRSLTAVYALALFIPVAFGFLIGLPIANAVSNPGSRQVQAAVKRCVLGLVVLDAVLAAAFVGLPGLAILLLLPPALVIGKWVYST